jgi:hypothetical protein
MLHRHQLISFSCNAGTWTDVSGTEYRQVLPPPTSDDASRRGYVRRKETEMPRTLHSENIFPCTKYTSSTCEYCLLKSIYHSRGSVDDVQRCRLCLFLQLMVINNRDFMLSFKLLSSRILCSSVRAS